MAVTRADRTPISTLRGRLRNVVGTIEILQQELEDLAAKAYPQKGRTLRDDGEERGVPNEYDHIEQFCYQLGIALEARRNEIRTFLSRRRPKRGRQLRKRKIVPGIDPPATGW